MIIIEVIRKRLKKAVNNHDKHPPWLSALLPISASPFSQNSYYLHTITKNIYGSLSYFAKMEVDLWEYVFALFWSTEMQFILYPIVPSHVLSDLFECIWVLIYNFFNADKLFL